MTRHYFFGDLPDAVRGLQAAMDLARSGDEVQIGPCDLELLSVTGLFVRVDPKDPSGFIQRLEDLFTKRKIVFSGREWEPMR